MYSCWVLILVNVGHVWAADPVDLLPVTDAATYSTLQHRPLRSGPRDCSHSTHTLYIKNKIKIRPPARISSKISDDKQLIFFTRPYVMKKPSRCWLGAVPRYWKVVASCFQIVGFAENTSAPLAPRARNFQPIPLLFLLFSCSWICLQNCCSDFFIPSQSLVAFKRRQTLLIKGYFRTFSNIKPTSGSKFEILRHRFFAGWHHLWALS